MSDLVTTPGIFPNLEPAAPPRAPGVPNPMDRVAYLAGGVWVARMPSGNGETVVEEAIRWAIEGSVLVSVQVTRREGQEPIEGFGLMAWNPEVERIQMMKIATNGMAEGQEGGGVGGPPETVTFVGKSTSASGTIEWRQGLTQVGADTMVTTTAIKEGSGYKPSPPCTFRRRGAAGDSGG
jgi:hypothetical protein